MSGRRDSGPGTPRVVSIAGDDAGHVRAVAVIVVRRGAAVDEVDELRHALPADHADLAVGAVVGQVVVP